MFQDAKVTYKNGVFCIDDGAKEEKGIMKWVIGLGIVLIALSFLNTDGILIPRLFFLLFLLFPLWILFKTSAKNTLSRSEIKSLKHRKRTSRHEITLKLTNGKWRTLRFGLEEDISETIQSFSDNGIEIK